MGSEGVICPTCGAAVRVEGDDREGTHYYVPVNDERLREFFEAMEGYEDLSDVYDGLDSHFPGWQAATPKPVVEEEQ